MKKICNKAMSQVELNKRYRTAHNLAVFGVRINRELLDRLNVRLAEEGVTKVEFLTAAINAYLDD